MLSDQKFGLYVHIPYCLQRCHYCDFATFEQSQMPPPAEYLDFLKREIAQRAQMIPHRELTSIYFGGGTPSLFPSQLILSLLQYLNKYGFRWSRSCEITIEVNPETLTKEKLQEYRQIGVNRLSVGAQSFDDHLLKICGRKHNAAATKRTLELIAEDGWNYSFDLLFALPGQKLEGLQSDLDQALAFQPNHLSAYCLTVPEGHPMDRGRAPEAEQIEMFELIESQLQHHGLRKYEVSNFAAPGYESQHNLTYWTYQPYWGIGLSAHSFLKHEGYGDRFWNSRRLPEYFSEVKNPTQIHGLDQLPNSRIERLKKHEALNDRIHVALRLKQGLSANEFQVDFSSEDWSRFSKRAHRLAAKEWLQLDQDRWFTTPRGELLFDRVLSELSFDPAPAAQSHH